MATESSNVTKSNSHSLDPAGQGGQRQGHEFVAAPGDWPEPPNRRLVTIAAIAWVAWVGFMIVMMILRFKMSPF